MKLIIKQHIIALIIFIMTFSSFAQQKKMPLQFLPEIGYAARSVPKDIYSGKPLNFGTHYGLNVRFGVSSKIAVGFEGQYQSFDIKSNIESTYQPMFQFDPTKVGTYNPTTIFNGIANVNYYNYNSKNTNLFEVGLGAGIQHLNQGVNNLEMENPFQIDTKTSVYRDGGKQMGLIGQLNIQNTFYIKPCFGIFVGMKFQYASTKYKVYYKEVPNEVNSIHDYYNFIDTETKVREVSFPITIIPTVGIRWQLRCNPRDNTPKDKACFALKWSNQKDEEKCFEGEKLEFKIKASGNTSALSFYEIYLAPYDNLTNQVHIQTLPNTATSFSINSSQLDANKKYDIIVKSVYPNNEGNCLQHIGPITRCADACKDAKLEK